MSIDRFTKFTNAKKGTTTGEEQSSIEPFLMQARGVQVYRQRQCNLSLSLVDKPSFRKFMAVVDERYCLVSRCSVTRQMRLGELTKRHSVCDCGHLDRAMRGFLGITAHFVELDNSTPNLQSVLLNCERFTGSHTGERISEKFEDR